MWNNEKTKIVRDSEQLFSVDNLRVRLDKPNTT